MHRQAALAALARAARGVKGIVASDTVFTLQSKRDNKALMAPAIRFLSLFVADLAATAKRYEAIFGVEPSEPDEGGVAPRPHPFAGAGPVVFQLGDVELSIYQADGRVTHPGDVGIGVSTDDPKTIASSAKSNGAQVFFGPSAIADENRQMAVFMQPDRHFFELLTPRQPST